MKIKTKLDAKQSIAFKLIIACSHAQLTEYKLRLAMKALDGSIRHRQLLDALNEYEVLLACDDLAV